jgi:hypothetical protein
VPLTITRAQRDAIYEIVIPHLTAIGDVWLCVKRREFAEAKKMSREFAQELRLLEGLGWSEAIDHDTVTLTGPPDELTRTVTRLHGAQRGRSASDPGLLDGIVCFARGAQHPVGDGSQPGPVLLESFCQPVALVHRPVDPPRALSVTDTSR